MRRCSTFLNGQRDVRVAMGWQRTGVEKTPFRFSR
jgi:hypothetical protein